MASLLEARPHGHVGTSLGPAASASRPGAVARLWRQARLGSAFVFFGASALFVAFVTAPRLRRRAATREQGELAVQAAIGRAFARSTAYFRLVRILTLDAAGLEQLGRMGPCVIVANHPTLIDVVLVGGFLRQMDCIVNAGWTAHSPFLSRAIDQAGYIRNDEGMAAVEECAARIRRGRSLLVFPEGTRSPRGSFGRLKRGAAHIALASGAPLVVVTIACRPRMLGSGRKWHDVADATSAFTLRIAGRLDPADYLAGGAGVALAARRMTEDLLAIFTQEPELADA